MAPTTSMRDLKSVIVSTLQLPSLPLSLTRFASAPGMHGLSRSAPKSLYEATLLLSSINSVALGLQKPSVSEELSPPQGRTATTVGSVQPATSIQTTDWTAVKDSIRHKHLLKCQSNRIEQYSTNVKGSLKTAFRNYGDKVMKKGRDAPYVTSHVVDRSSDQELELTRPAGSPQDPQCTFAEDEDADVHPIIQALMFNIEIRRSVAAVDPNFPQASLASSSSSFAVAATKADASTELMDQGVEWLSPASQAQTEGSNTEVDCDPSKSYASTVLPKALDSEVTQKDVTGLQSRNPLGCLPQSTIFSFIKQYNLGRRHTLVKSPPNQPSPALAPKPRTKGDASRSPMDDIMAGPASLIKPESSGKQTPVAALPSHPTAPNVPSAKPAFARTQSPFSHNVGSRQDDPPCTLPNHIGARPEVVAWRGSVIPSCRAPSSPPMDCEAKVPATPNQQRRQAAPPSTLSTHVGTGAEAVASQGSVIPSSRAPSSAPTDGEAKALTTRKPCDNTGLVKVRPRPLLLGTVKIATQSPAKPFTPRPSSSFSTSPTTRSPTARSARCSSYMHPLSPAPSLQPSTASDEVKMLKARLVASESRVKLLTKEKFEAVAASQRLSADLKTIQDNQIQWEKEKESLSSRKDVGKFFPFYLFLGWCLFVSFSFY
ncbi:hypothetical protein FRC04_003189 [Tulasnella sp. 424]|nr:hypothetical protein FRC04_003189 [Tulasnella sp. 424]KAG8966207.1 hypothetical protein FRC05_002746 [Tulasnella sp. 425]